MSPDPTSAAQPLRDPREQWYSPYRGLPIGLSFKWLLGGAALYALLLLVAIAGNPGEAAWPIVGPNLYLTPVFGAPYVFGTLNRPGRTRRIFYFLALLPLLHMAANYAACYYALATYDPFDPAGQYFRNLATGAIGGGAGALLGFAGLHLMRLTSRPRVEMAMMALGIVALAAIGAATMARGLAWTAAFEHRDDAERVIVWYETVHAPWQAAFALFLAWLMRPARGARSRETSQGIDGVKAG
ncbi:MAG: hypothetical protein WDN24_18145 [Sphingomonas sp.]